MNARQKAKKLKKELAWLKSQPFRNVYKVTNIPIEHYKAETCIEYEQLRYMGEYAKEIVRSDLASEITQVIKNRLIIQEEFDGHGAVFTTDIFIGFGRR